MWKFLAIIEGTGENVAVAVVFRLPRFVVLGAILAPLVWYLRRHYGTMKRGYGNHDPMGLD